MKDRTAVFGALAVGLVAVGGLFLLSRRAGGADAPRLLGRTVVGGLDGPRLRFDLAPSPALQRRAAAGETWDYRLVDASGRLYGAAEGSRGSLFVDLAYGRPVEGPRLEVWSDGDLLASKPLAPLPAPHVEPLAVAPNAPIRAFHLLGAEVRAAQVMGLAARPLAMGEANVGYVRFAPAERPARNERWRIEILRTPLQADPHASAALTTDSPMAGVAPLPYADDVTAVRVRVARTQETVESERVVLKGLRLVSQAGQTVLRWPDSKVASGRGLDVRMVETDPPYDVAIPPGQDGDRRAPCLDLRISPTRFETDSEEIVGVDAQKLGVRWLRVGHSTLRAPGRLVRPIDPRPFDLPVRLVWRRSKPLRGFEATIPVEPAALGQRGPTLGRQ